MVNIRINAMDRTRDAYFSVQKIKNTTETAMIHGKVLSRTYLMLLLTPNAI
jgi:hypothetical protein